MSASPRRPRPRRQPWMIAVAGLLVVAGCSSAVAGTALPGPSVLRTTPALPPSPVESSPVGPSITTPTTVSEPTTPVTSNSSGTAPPSSATTTSPAGPNCAFGAAGIGDPYYPESGNGGYQVEKYDIKVSYTPETNQLSGVTIINAVVTEDENLCRFNLDLQAPMKVSAVTVDGLSAQKFERNDAELIITPVRPLEPKSKLQVVVTYSGQPGAVPGGTAGLGDGGWYRTRSGGAIVAGQPFSASSWYPANEHPADLATYAITATVPSKWKVISNGVEFDGALGDPGAGKTSSRWIQDVPVATYLTTLYVDTFSLVTDKLDDGTPIVSAIAPGDQEDKELAKNTKKIIEVLTDYFGPYPFKAAGGIYTDEQLQFALETATRPVYADWVDLDTVVHELAHQWYGDQTAVKTWADICLNECFASYAPWLWHEKQDNADLDAYWKAQMGGAPSSQAFWASPLVDMGAGNEFTRVYDRGPIALHALRREIGDDAFFQLLKQWPAKTKGTNVTFDQWEAMATEIAGKDLTAFVDVWFRGTKKPTAAQTPAALR